MSNDTAYIQAIGSKPNRTFTGLSEILVSYPGSLPPPPAPLNSKVYMLFLRVVTLPQPSTPCTNYFMDAHNQSGLGSGYPLVHDFLASTLRGITAVNDTPRRRADTCYGQQGSTLKFRSPRTTSQCRLPRWECSLSPSRLLLLSSLTSNPATR